MTADYIRNIQRLADACDACTTTVYFPDFESGADTLNRVWGAPLGVTTENWPRYPKLRALFEMSDVPEGWDGEDTRMEHVFTIDLAGIEARWAPKGARVMMLFVSNTSYNEAWAPGTPHTAVVFLDEAAVQRGLCRAPLPLRRSEHDERRFAWVPVRVPDEVFAPAGDRAEDHPLSLLRKAIWQAPARLGGDPIWLQGDPDDDFGGDEDDDVGGDESDEVDADESAPSPPVGLPATGEFCLQFDENFADVNLGDCGVMYVFGGDAHYQCY